VTWVAVLAASAGVYLIKLTGLSVPERVLHDARVRRVAELLPVALLAALALTQTVTTGHRVVLDARAAGLAVAVVAVALRAPFLVVVGLAALTAALLRLVA
jgi:branched-subunit amino acid transport protein